MCAVNFECFSVVCMRNEWNFSFPESLYAAAAVVGMCHFVEVETRVCRESFFFCQTVRGTPVGFSIVSLLLEIERILTSGSFEKLYEKLSLFAFVRDEYSVCDEVEAQNE